MGGVLGAEAAAWGANWLQRTAMPYLGTQLRQAASHIATSPPELLIHAMQRGAIPAPGAWAGSAFGAAIEHQYKERVGKPVTAAATRGMATGYQNLASMLMRDHPMTRYTATRNTRGENTAMPSS